MLSNQLDKGKEDQKSRKPNPSILFDFIPRVVIRFSPSLSDKAQSIYIWSYVYTNYIAVYVPFHLDSDMISNFYCG